jgi:hypothetical protein
MIEPGVEFVYEVEAVLGPAVAQGVAPDGERRFIPILSGRFEGPLLRGAFVEGGADWQVTRADGVFCSTRSMRCAPTTARSSRCAIAACAPARPG